MANDSTVQNWIPEDGSEQRLRRDAGHPGAAQEVPAELRGTNLLDAVRLALELAETKRQLEQVLRQVQDKPAAEVQLKAREEQLKKALEERDQARSALRDALTEPGPTAITIPDDVRRTLKELPAWSEIPRGKGRARRVQALVDWVLKLETP